jgi:hypothetical protein
MTEQPGCVRISILALGNLIMSKLECQRGKNNTGYLQTAEDIEITFEDLSLSDCKQQS